MSDAALGQGPRPPIGYWPEPTDDPGVDLRREPVVAVAEDGGVSRGVLWLPPAGTDARTLVALTHPRGDFSVHYVAPLLAAAGYAVCGFATRYVNNDVDCLHEKAAADVVAMVSAVRSRFDAVVLLGNSGGGSLMSLAMAENASLGDGFIAVAAHPGEGVFMLQVIDPSVVDEDDPFAVDPDLDMYNPDNGWKPWPEESSYDREWLARYRRAQRDRVARIDERARRLIAEGVEARDAMKASEKGSAEWIVLRRRATFVPYMRIWRTLADPAYLDPTIDPDDRPLGSIFAFPDPMAGNWGYGLSRLMTPRGWLSTWSGLSSDAEVAKNLPHVTVPTLVVHPTADTEIRRHQAQAIFDGSGASDKVFVEIKGAEHYLQGRRREAMDAVIAWLGERFPR